MKNIFLLIFSICSIQILSAQTHHSNLIAHYNFDVQQNRDSTVIYDISGHQNHGSIIGVTNYTTDRFGIDCSALFFNGNTYVTVPDSRSLNSPRNGITIAVWFKLASGADFFNQWITICCKSDQSIETASSPQYRMQATAQTVSLSTDFTEHIIPQLEYETWYFYAYTFDKNMVKVYLNGDFIFERPYVNNLVANKMPLEIGRDVPGKLEYYYGAMDDLRIYNKSLSGLELDQLYQDRSGEHDRDRCMEAEEEKYTDINDDKGIDTLVVVPAPPVQDNTPIALPDSIVNMPIDYQKVIEVKNTEVTFYPYDNKKEDGDIVSININGVWVKDSIEIKNKITRPAAHTLIKFTLNAGNNNYFISRAWNLGRRPPNTLTVAIDDGFSVQEVKIDSEIGLSGGIQIICSPEGGGG